MCLLTLLKFDHEPNESSVRSLDKRALIASSLAEKKKLEDHEAMLKKYGIRSLVVDFQKLGIAFGRQALDGKLGCFWTASFVFVGATKVHCH